jgi:hypothetical protein
MFSAEEKLEHLEQNKKNNLILVKGFRAWYNRPIICSELRIACSDSLSYLSSDLPWNISESYLGTFLGHKDPFLTGEHRLFIIVVFVIKRKIVETKLDFISFSFEKLNHFVG